MKYVLYHDTETGYIDWGIYQFPLFKDVPLNEFPWVSWVQILEIRDATEEEIDVWNNER